MDKKQQNVEEKPLLSSPPLSSSASSSSLGGSSSASSLALGRSSGSADGADDTNFWLKEYESGGMSTTANYATFDIDAPEEQSNPYRTLPNFHGSRHIASLAGHGRSIIYDNDRKKVQAIFAYKAKNPGELSLEVGDIITVTNNADLDWWEGVLPNGKRGRFPSNYCTKLDLLEPQQAVTEEGLQEIEDIMPSVQSGKSGLEKVKPKESTESTKKKKKRKDSDEKGPPVTLWEKTQMYLSEYIFIRMMIYFLLCGIVTSLISVGIDYASQYTYKLRSMPFSHINSKFLRFLYWFSFSAVLTSIAYAFTKFISPFSAGSGIPEVKVIMSGVELPQYLSFRVLVGKTLGLTLALSAGLFAGKQGPMTHIGAVVATLLASLKPFKCTLSHLLLYE